MGISFTCEEVARVCRAWGKMLWAPQGIDGVRLLWAISGCESSFGANCEPRHEPAYDVGGLYAKNPEMAALLQEYGSAAACSYGPWQLLLVNCLTPGCGPDEMARIDRCGLETVRFLNVRIFEALKPTTVAQVAEAYNSGKWRWQVVPPGVERYAEECVKYYESEPMPAAPVATS